MKIPAVWQELKTAGPFRSLLAFTAGVALPLAGYLLPTMPSGRSVLDKGHLLSGGPWLLQLLFRIFSLLAKIWSWPWIVLVFLVFTGFAIVQRREEKGWTFAFVAAWAFLAVLHEIIFRL